MKYTLVFLIGFLSLLVPASGALMDGKSVGLTSRYPDVNSVTWNYGSATVGSQVEFGEGGTIDYTINITDTSIILSNMYYYSTSYLGADFNGWVITDVGGTIDPFGYATVNASTNVAGFDNSRLIVAPDYIGINLAGLTVGQGFYIQVDVAPVPEPASIAFTGAGVAALIAVRVRRRQISLIRI